MIGMLPVGVLAAENGKALQAGAGAIEKNDTVYYGTEQRAWQALSTNGNGGTYSDGTNAVIHTRLIHPRRSIANSCWMPLTRLFSRMV